MAQTGLVTQFDDLMKCYTVLLNENSEKAFITYVKNSDTKRQRWKEAVDEAKRLRQMLDVANKNISTIDSKLSSARRMLDSERQQRKKVELERNTLLEQLEDVKKILFSDNKNKIPDDTKEKLSFLNGAGRFNVDYNRLDTITEFDSTSASNLSDISFSRSEDDLDEFSRCRGKKHRPSYPCEEPVSAKRKRSDIGGQKSHEISLTEKRTREIAIDGESTDHLIATTTVTVRQGGPVSAKSVIEKFPAPEVKPETVLSTPTASDRDVAIEQMKYTPSAPVLPYTPSAPILETPEPDVPKTARTPRTYESALGMINSRIHSFVPKKVYLPEYCCCGSKITFGARSIKCTTCNAVAHYECRDKVPLPCLSMGTPSKPGVVGYIQDYTPLVPPMVPALVIHCINEIEQRGLTELGIYRVPGSDKEVRSLKEKFLRGKGAPNLSAYEIHAICGCLKDFLRSLQDSLVPAAQWGAFGEAAEKKNDQQLYQAISELPQPNRDTLAFLILHLQRVAESKHCKMTKNALARVFALTLTKSPPSTQSDVYNETHVGITIVEALLSLSTDYWSTFIVEPPIDANTPATIRHTPSTESLMRKTSRKFLKTPKTPGSSKKRYFDSYLPNHD